MSLIFKTLQPLLVSRVMTLKYHSEDIVL